jgi:GT2 family glycosyltransferase
MESCNNQKKVDTTISIITCSVDDAKFDAFKKNVKEIFGDDVQLIRINDAESIAEGYNRGIDQAYGDILIFCHDDIEFLNADAAELIKDDLKKNDIVGVAGTSLLTDGIWISAGQPFTHGQVLHELNQSDSGYNLCVYGLGRDDTIVHDIQALDGLFFAVKRDVVDKVRFDEQLFDGFHLYDLDFTYAAYLKGARIIVDYKIHLLHKSIGNYDHNWKRYAERFNRKYSKIDPAGRLNRCILTKGISSQSKDTLAQEMQRNNTANRIYLQAMPAQRPGQMKLRIESEASRSDMIVTTQKKIPYPDDSINYLCFQFQSLSELEKKIYFTEIFRISSHGAIAECVQVMPQGCRDQAENTERFENCFFWPKVIYLSNENNNQGALLLMGTNNDGARMRKAYFQISKKVAA